MAENESLDLNTPGARRWNTVRDAAMNGGSCQQVSELTRKSFLKAIRKVLREFEESGVTTADFLASRGSPQAMKTLIRRTKNHPYAELLFTVIDSNPDTSPAECLQRWGHAILDKVFAQISLDLGGSGIFPNFYETQSFFDEVRDEVRADLDRLSAKLAADPHWKPVVRAKKGEAKIDPTESQLPVSLIGGPKR
jgi:hypothetical protein